MSAKNTLHTLLDKTTWTTATLGDMCDMYQPKTISLKDMIPNGAFPVFGANGKIGRYNRYNHEQPEVLLGCRGTCGIVNMSEPRSWITSNAMVIRPKNEQYLKQSFLYYLLMGGANLQHCITGTAQPQITRASLIPITLPLPPPEKQQKLATFLDEAFALIDDLIDNAQRRLTLIQQLKTSFLYRAFEEVDKTGWKTRPLGEVFAVRTGYTPSKDEPAYWENGTIPFVTMEDIRENGQKLDKFRQYVTEAAVKGGRVFPANSFIISTSATIGEHAFVKVPYISNQRFVCLTLNPEFEGRLDRDFIFFYLYVLGNWCRQNVNVGTFAQVRMGLFRQFPFSIPPLPEQQKIANFLDNAFNNVALLADNATTRLNTVKHLKTALLAKVFHEPPLTAPPHSTPDKESIPKDHTPKESTA